MTGVSAGAHAGTGAAVFLDRDGVINQLCYDPEHGLVDSPLHVAQVRLTATARQGLRLLQEDGRLLVVVSNQPAVAKGKMTWTTLRDITDVIYDELAAAGVYLDAAYYCLHHPESAVPLLRGECDCRKPAPGLLLRAVDDLGIDLSRSWLIGDGFPDVLAANRAGCRSVWIGTRRCDQCQTLNRVGARPDAVAADVIEAAHLILAAGRRWDATVC